MRLITSVLALLKSQLHVGVYLAGEESTKRSASGHRMCLVHLLCTVHAGVSCNCGSCTLLCNGSWHSHFICICKPWDAMGSVSVWCHWNFQFIQVCSVSVINKLCTNNYFSHCQCRYIITVGAVTALCSTLMGSILPQVNEKGTQVPFRILALTWFIDAPLLLMTMSITPLYDQPLVSFGLLVIPFIMSLVIEDKVSSQV